MLIANIVPDDDAAEPGGCCPEHSEVEDMFGVQGREKWRVKSFNKTKFFMFHLLTSLVVLYNHIFRCGDNAPDHM